MAESNAIEYTGDSGVRLEVKCDGETVWLSEQQMSLLFGRSQSVINRHINAVFSEGELQKDSNMHFLHITNICKPIAYFSLDVVISAGYRVKSIEGTRFRQWATRKLKEIMMARLLDARRIDALEGRVETVEQGLSILANEFNEWTILPAHKPMGFGAAERHSS